MDQVELNAGHGGGPVKDVAPLLDRLQIRNGSSPEAELLKVRKPAQTARATPTTCPEPRRSR